VKRAEVAAANRAKMRARCEARFHEALKAPTLEGAIEAYGRSHNTFWRLVKRLDMASAIEALYPEDVARRERERVERARESFKTARAAQLEQEREETANLIEDAEWLAITGENQDGAVRRLGFNTWNALYNRLTNNGRADITDRLTGNTEGRGRVSQGVISHHGRRL
jgi:hypothetical protein